MDPFMRPEHIQGSAEWLAHRQKHLGASDAAAAMGISPWVTPYQLWAQKTGLEPGPKENDAMRRGTAMEPFARAAFEKEIGIEVFPQVLYHSDVSFMMASMDGLTIDKMTGVEIKCPGKRAHETALAGKVPEYYMPQLQHQLAVIDRPMIWYYSYDGEQGVAIQVKRDEEFIENLIKAETEFWRRVVEYDPPPFTDKDYQDREGALWAGYGRRIADLDEKIKQLKDERNNIRDALIEDCGSRSSRGGGLTLSRSFPKGSVDYGKIPQLEGVDLNQYRSEPKEKWTLRSKTTNETT